MSPAPWKFIVSGLDDLASILGVVGTVTLIGIVVAALLALLYMVLEFGDRAIHMFLPFFGEAFKALRSESAKNHLAIKLEMRLQVFLGAIIVFCLLAHLLHALVPWVREGTEQVFLAALITSAFLFVAMACVSITLSLRLK